MALPLPRVAVKRTLAAFLKTNLQAAWPNLVISDTWPTPKLPFPPQALTVRAVSRGQVVGYHQPVVWQQTATQTTYSYGVIEVPVTIDLWAQFPAVRDDLAAAVLPLLNQNVENTLGTATLANLSLAPGLVLHASTYANAPVEYRFDPTPDSLSGQSAAMVGEWRYVWHGTATTVLMQLETQPAMRDVTIELGANGAAPERVAYTYEGQVLADAPNLYWRLGDAAGALSVQDYSASGNTGTVAGAPTFGAAGLISVGIMTNDVITAAQASAAATSVTASKAVALGTGGAFTLEWWIKPSALTAGGNDLGQSSATIKVSQNADGSLAISVGNTALSAPAGTYSVGKTVYCALTYDGASARFYVNGQLVTGPTAAASPGSSLSAFALCGTGPWQSTVEEVAVYPAALAPARILNHFFIGSNGP